MTLRHFSSRWPLVISLAASLVIASIAAAISLDLRRSIGLRATENAENLVRAIERDIGRNIEVLGLSLQAVVEGVSRADVMDLTPNLRRLVLFDRSSSASALGAVIVFDRNGEVVLDAAQDDPRSIKPVTDREYFQALRKNDPGLFISRPYVSRLIGVPVVGLSRRITASHGTFGGVAHATIQLSYFSGLFDKLMLGPNAVVSLIRLDGDVIVRRSSGRNAVENVMSSPVFKRMLGSLEGSFIATSAFDGVERLYAFSRVGDAPLILSVAISTADLYADWFAKTLLAAAAILFVCGIVVGLTFVLAREVATRAQAERQLLDANAALSTLSRTDPLTSLGNRRSFTEDLEHALVRAAAAQGPVGLILLDVDQFKRFNDRYGHPAGDAALLRIGRTLAAVSQAHGVKAYRIGGEEFAVVVTDHPSAFSPRLAESLRLAVRAERIQHADLIDGIATVSLGVAATSGGPVSLIMANADAALYEAKRGGRDRVAVDADLASPAERLRELTPALQYEKPRDGEPTVEGRRMPEIVRIRAAQRPR